MRFQIRGLDRESGHDKTIIIDAPNDDAAREEAKKQAIVVESVTPIYKNPAALNADRVARKAKEGVTLNYGEGIATAFFIMFALGFWLVGGVWLCLVMFGTPVQNGRDSVTPSLFVAIGFLSCISALMTEMRAMMRHRLETERNHST